MEISEALPSRTEDTGPEPRLELFARFKRGGWAPWGNVVPKVCAVSLAAFGSDGSDTAPA